MKKHNATGLYPSKFNNRFIWVSDVARRNRIITYIILIGLLALPAYMIVYVKDMMYHYSINVSIHKNGTNTRFSSNEHDTSPINGT